jgi:hypothetical protein
VDEAAPVLRINLQLHKLVPLLPFEVHVIIIMLLHVDVVEDDAEALDVQDIQLLFGILQR